MSIRLFQLYHFLVKSQSCCPCFHEGLSEEETSSVYTPHPDTDLRYSAGLLAGKLNSSVIPAVGLDGYGDDEGLGDVCGVLVAVVGFHFCLMALTRKPAGFFSNSKDLLASTFF